MSKPRILVVEDSSSIRQWFVSVLTSSAEVATAGNGLEAINQVWTAWERRKPYEAILMDIVMPVMDGLTAVKEIRRLERQQWPDGSRCCSIVVVSRLTDPEDILQAQYHCGADGYVTKPCAASTVLQTIANLGIDLHQARTQRCRL